MPSREQQRSWERALLLRLTRDTRQLLGSPWRTLDLRRLGRVLIHSMLVGALAGAAACLFFYAIEWAQWLLQGELAHYHPPRAAGEVHITPEPAPGKVPRTWLLALLPAAGGLLCGLLIRLAPEAAGTGGDAYIDAVHNKQGRIRGRAPLIKALASVVTISSGGSAGREGPIMHTCAGLASITSRWLGLSAQERRILVVAGAAAGTGAIFRTPLGAALYAVEVLYRDDFETDAIVPAVLGSVTGYSIFTTVFGQGHLFTTHESYAFVPAALPLYGAMALGIALFGAVFVALRDAIVVGVFGRFAFLPRWLMPAVGGLLLGALSLGVPQALGVGYGLVQGAIEGASWIPWGQGGYWLLFGLAAAKMVSTSLTVGSQASGGAFGPSIVIGGLVGGGFGILFQGIAPNLAPQPGAFALVGMGALIGGIAHVPVSSLIMVCEMAGSYDLLVPLMFAEAIAFVLLRRVTIFSKQVATRVDSPAHRHDSTVDLLESLVVRDVYERGVQLATVRAGDPLSRVLEVISEAHVPGVLVQDQQGKNVGLISLDAVQGAILQEGLEGLALAADVMSPLHLLSPDDDLHDVLHAFLVTGMSVLPVTDEQRNILGVITHLDVTRAYDAAVAERVSARAQAQP